MQAFFFNLHMFLFATEKHCFIEFVQKYLPEVGVFKRKKKVFFFLFFFLFFFFNES